MMANANAEMAEVSFRPIELSFPLPKAPETRIHLQLTIQTTSILLFLTTVLNGDTSTAAPLGSFVYALPDVSQVLDTIAETSRTDRITENESRPNYLNPSLHLRVLCRVHHPPSQTTSTENRKASLRWKFHKFC
jgi:hypothetical protein